MKNNQKNKPVLNVSGVPQGRLKPQGIPSVKSVKVKANESKAKP